MEANCFQPQITVQQRTNDSQHYGHLFRQHGLLGYFLHEMEMDRESVLRFCLFLVFELLMNGRMLRRCPLRMSSMLTHGQSYNIPHAHHTTEDFRNRQNEKERGTTITQDTEIERLDDIVLGSFAFGGCVVFKWMQV